MTRKRAELISEYLQRSAAAADEYMRGDRVGSRLEDHAMNAQAEKTLLEKLKSLPPARLAEADRR